MIIKTSSLKELQESIMSISRPFILISIRSLSAQPIPHIPTNPMMEDVLYLSFLDQDDLQSTDMAFFSKKHAQQIKYFLDKYRGIVDEIIVQCQMGQSRSTAIAAILQLYLNHDIKASKRYFKYFTPNKRVFKMMKDYFLDDQDV